MSAGNFVDSLYETNANATFRCKVQPETLTAVLNGNVNAASTGTPVDTNPSAKMTGGRREIGVNARLVRFRFTNTLPPGYAANQTLTIPVMTPGFFAALRNGQVGTYTLEGTAYDITIVGTTPETVR